MSSQRLADLEELYNETDQLCNGWLSHARDMLRELTRLSKKLQEEEGMETRLMLVTTGELMPTLAKLMLFKLDVRASALAAHGPLT